MGQEVTFEKGDMVEIGTQRGSIEGIAPEHETINLQKVNNNNKRIQAMSIEKSNYFQNQLKNMGACRSAGNKTLYEAWNVCERGDWMLWLAANVYSREVHLKQAKQEARGIIRRHKALLKRQEKLADYGLCKEAVRVQLRKEFPLMYLFGLIPEK